MEEKEVERFGESRGTPLVENCRLFTLAYRGIKYTMDN